MAPPPKARKTPTLPFAEAQAVRHDRAGRDYFEAYDAVVHGKLQEPDEPTKAPKTLEQLKPHTVSKVATGPRGDRVIKKPMILIRNRSLYRVLVLLPLNILYLPTHIREKIWAYTIPEPKTMGYNSYKPWSGPLPRVERKAASLMKNNVMALARVCKQLDNEAVPILYKKLIFKFDTIGAMDAFFRQYDRTRQHIRHINIEGQNAWQYSYRRTFLGMHPMMSLRSFTLDYRCIDWRPGRGGDNYTQVALNAFFGKIAAFLGDWHKANKDRAGAGSVMDLVKVVGEGGGWCPGCVRGSEVCKMSSEHCKLWKKNMELAMRASTAYRLKRMIAGRLGIAL